MCVNSLVYKCFRPITRVELKLLTSSPVYYVVTHRWRFRISLKLSLKGREGMKKFSWPRHSVLIIAIVATWFTTYVGYITSFNMKIDNRMQEFILFLNPLSFLLFVYGLALFMKSTKRRNIYMITVSILTSIVMFSNAVFYRFFNDFITLPVLFQTSNFGDLSLINYGEFTWNGCLFLCGRHHYHTSD